MIKLIMIVLPLLASFMSCTVYKNSDFSLLRSQEPFFAENTPDYIDDAELFDAKKKISLTVLQSGKLLSSLSQMINLKHPACAEMTDQSLTVPIYAYLLTHEEHGIYMIDTGVSNDYVNNNYGNMKGLLLPFVMSKTVVRSENTIENILNSMNIKVEKLKGVFFTHLHFDHTSGLSSFPRPLLLVAGADEFSPNIPVLLKPGHFRKSDILYRIAFDQKYASDSSIGRVVDIFGDGSIWAIWTPGHSKGHISYLVNTCDGPVLVAGDALMNYHSIKYGCGPGKCFDGVDKAQATIDRLISFIKKNPQVRVLAGHDYPTDNE
ncbi:MAG: MBL fold metallo-hydrolase [Spirochaetes bacterium]|nr:MBL fold metallo-hydrolase [Spirochaetota bacterium]MBN2771953.1 MBL fold metallo-hydrolase [Spirochaetota bacterium]